MPIKGFFTGFIAFHYFTTYCITTSRILPYNCSLQDSTKVWPHYTKRCFNQILTANYYNLWHIFKRNLLVTLLPVFSYINTVQFMKNVQHLSKMECGTIYWLLTQYGSSTYLWSSAVICFLVFILMKLDRCQKICTIFFLLYYYWVNYSFNFQ